MHTRFFFRLVCTKNPSVNQTSPWHGSLPRTRRADECSAAPVASALHVTTTRCSFFLLPYLKLLSSHLPTPVLLCHNVECISNNHRSDRCRYLMILAPCDHLKQSTVTHMFYSLSSALIYFVCLFMFDGSKNSFWWIRPSSSSFSFRNKNQQPDPDETKPNGANQVQKKSLLAWVQKNRVAD